MTLGTSSRSASTCCWTAWSVRSKGNSVTLRVGPIKVLAHFVPGDKARALVAPQADWLDVRYCAEDDDDTFYRELPEAEVIWHVLRPLSGDDLERAKHCKLVQKLGAGVNTVDVEAATRLGI